MRSNPIITKVCPNCGAMFVWRDTPSRQRRYCSIVCQHVGLRSQEADVWNRIERGNGCWPWKGARSIRGGYGTLNYKGRLWPAHRLVWALTHPNDPLPEVVMHTCDNPPCCRPDHLIAGTHLLNVHDKCAKGRANLPTPEKRLRGMQQSLAKLNDDQIREIRARYLNGESSPKLAHEYGVNHTLILRIHHHKVWAHVTD